jgi:hypothetical protein
VASALIASLPRTLPQALLQKIAERSTYDATEKIG